MSKVPRIIGIAYNLKTHHRDGDSYEEYDESETIDALRKEIECLGFKVVLLEQDDRLESKILRARPDFVFNIAEGRGSARSRESQVPCVLESLNIPYSGSDPLSLGLTLDKFLTNRILKSYGIPVPWLYMISHTRDLAQATHIFEKQVRVIVKPRWEGSSKGIFNNSVVDDFKGLATRVKFILTQYQQPALIEEFLEKDEVTVGVYGNEPARVLGMMRISSRLPCKEYFLYSQENKKDWLSKIAYDTGVSLSAAVRKKIYLYALQAFAALQLRDVSRIDFRLSAKGVPKIIDVNALPGLSPHYSDLPILYRLKGGSYPDLIKIILEAAFSRYGFHC